MLSLVTVALSPFTTRDTFLPNLLAMHGLIVIPLCSARLSSPSLSRYSINLTSLYCITGFIAAAIHIRTTAVAVSSVSTKHHLWMDFFRSAWEILHSHPAQSSIGFDVVWTTISFLVWISISPSPRPRQSKLVNVFATSITTLLASVGVVSPWVLQCLEDGGVVKSE